MYVQDIICKYMYAHAYVCTLQSKRTEMPTDSGTQGRFKKVRVTLRLIAVASILKFQITFIKNSCQCPNSILNKYALSGTSYIGLGRTYIEKCNDDKVFY